jgi:hypothetical protein
MTVNQVRGSGTGVSFGGVASTIQRESINLATAAVVTAAISGGEDLTITVDTIPANTKVRFENMQNTTALSFITSGAIYAGVTGAISAYVSNSTTAAINAVHTQTTGVDAAGVKYTAASPLVLTIRRSVTTAPVTGSVNLVYQLLDLNPVAGPASF